jgi:hypothetical protein
MNSIKKYLAKNVRVLFVVFLPFLAWNQSDSASGCVKEWDEKLQDSVVLVPDVMVEYIDGDEALYQKIGKEFKIKNIDSSLCPSSIGCQKFYIKFTISEKGETEDVTVKGEISCPEIENQIAEFYKTLRWKPAHCDGKAVKSFLTIPSYIILER